MERGKRVPRIDTAFKLATILSAAFDDLLTGIVWHPEPDVVHMGGFEIIEDEADER